MADIYVLAGNRQKATKVLNPAMNLALSKGREKGYNVILKYIDNSEKENIN